MPKDNLDNVTNRLDIRVDTNAVSEEADGIVQFQDGLIISDESEQVNGTRYDHSNTSLDKWSGEVFADHGGEKGYTVERLIGTAFGKVKKGGRITIEGIKYAMNNPLGRLYHDMLVDGQSKNFSIGTSGSEPDKNGVYKDHEIYELSQVGLGNNRSARAETVLTSALNRYEREGMDTSSLRKLLTQDLTNKKGDSMTKIKNQDTGDGEQKDESKEESQDESKEEVKVTVEETTVSDGDTAADDGGDDSDDSKDADDSKTDQNSIKKMVENAVKPIKGELAKYKQAFDEGAEEPEWQLNKSDSPAPIIVKGKTQAEQQLAKMDGWERAGQQLLAFCSTQKGDKDAAKTLNAVNEYNLKEWKSLSQNDLKKLGVYKNTFNLSDFGNFVTSPEMQSEIEGFVTDYSEPLRFFTYQNTNSRDFQWLTRSGDISFDDVDGIDDTVGVDTLKPVDEYTGTTTTSRLQELAAVTPISTTANLFLAVDLIKDAAMMYRNEADRRFAQLPIARLEQAMEEDATRSVSWDTGSQTSAQKFSNLRSAIASISQANGSLVLTEASHFLIYDLLHQVGAGSGLTESVVNGNPARSLWGRNLVVVPNDLMPTLDDTNYTSITNVRPVAGGAPATVTVNHGIFYVNSQNWVGKTNGNLRYDLSTEASYEEGGTVKSAFARNEVLLRGSIFRGGAIKDKSRIKGVRAEAVIS